MSTHELTTDEVTLLVNALTDKAEGLKQKAENRTGKALELTIKIARRYSELAYRLTWEHERQK